MNPLKCDIELFSLSKHLQQILTGFSLLAKEGFIKLSQKYPKFDRTIAKKNTSFVYEPLNAYLKATINNAVTITYDTRDTYKINTNHLQATDFYFKRSYSKKEIIQHPQSNKIFPLGLNYLVYIDKFDFLDVKRNFVLGASHKKLYGFFKMLNYRNLFKFYPTTTNMHSFPNMHAEPKIIFMTRAWNPKKFFGHQREETIKINHDRAMCIKLLKENFGTNFYGGFMHTQYAVKNFNDFLCPKNSLTKKSNYIKLLNQFPICITTKGLQNSVGWKFSEYVAFSKAIVTEALDSLLPGGFEEGKNYLSFNTPDKCIQQTNTLFHNSALRKYLMKNNYEYYHHYLRPDVLILNSIITALLNSND